MCIRDRTGSFETNTIYYKDDSKTEAESPEDHFGSNNYLKLDYYQGKFAVGVQLEAYEPVLVGYPAELEKAKLTNYYVSWADKDFSVTAGTFYEQFGSGLLFRSWEDPVSYTHLRAHETRHDLVCRLLLEKKKQNRTTTKQNKST